MAVIRVLIDTREQVPYQFKEARVTLKALETGDYALYGDPHGMVIERKSVEDLFGTLTKGLDRFRREMERLSQYAFPVLLVEGTPAMVKQGARYSEANGNRILDHVIALCITYGVAPVFCDNRAQANNVAWILLKERHALKTKGVR